MLNCTTIFPTEEENQVLSRLNSLYRDYTEMWPYEIEFLNALLLREKPGKVLEIGISSGASSVIITNALREIEGARLYAVDLSKEYYKDPGKPSGFLLESYPDLKTNYEKHLGGIACQFLDTIGDGIDFAFIDTAHVFPGEVLDFLMTYPFLKPDAMVVFHDTSLNLFYPGCESAYVTGMLCSAVTGEKYQPAFNVDDMKLMAAPNITAIKFTPETHQRLWEVFNLLTHTWAYPVAEEHLGLLVEHFSRFYPNDAVDFFKRINDCQNARFFNHGSQTHLPFHSSIMQISPKKITRLHYYRYKLLSKITFGNTRKYYKEKRKALKSALAALAAKGK